VRAASNYDGGRALSGIGGGTINGRLESHEDALAVDAKVEGWFQGVAPGGRDMVAAWSERGTPPPLPATLPLLHPIPVLKADGDIRMEYHPVNRRAYLCLLDWVGYSAAEIAAYELRHRLFLALLDILPGLKLSKWKVSGRGLTDCGESLTRNPTIRALRPEA
jgi:hypothetical protein